MKLFGSHESLARNRLTDVIVDGVCSSAQTLISKGRIDCKVALCPDHCVMCQFCLESLNCSPEQTGAPSLAPTMTESLNPTETLGPSSQPSSLPSGKPTHLPSFGPTIMKSDVPTSFPTSIPTIGFDLADCLAYSDDWMSDIIITGVCKRAKENIDKNVIICGLDRCPLDCGICSFCLSSLGCEQGPEPSASPTISPTVAQTETFDLANCSTYSIDWYVVSDLCIACF